jgi:hypothetical protein
MNITLKQLKKIIFIPIVCFLLSSCASIFTPSNPESWMESEKNACLPTAIAFREGLRKYNVWAEVVGYHFYYTNTKKKKPSGHAIVAYMYPTGQNKLWTYDHWGSYRVRAYKDDPLDIAKKAVEARQEDRYITSAHFHK